MNPNAKQLPSERHGIPQDSTSSAILDAERRPQDNAKHTTGPWHFFNSGAGLIRSENGKTIAQLKSVSRQGFRKAADLDEEVANARLIAASPELLRELKKCVSAIQKWGKAHPESGGWTGLIHGGLAAISQAEGGAQ